MATVVANVAGPPQIPSGSIVDSPSFTGTHIGDTYPIAQSFVAVSCPSDVTEDTLATITVPANMLGANGSLRIHTDWSFTNNANSKTLRVRYSGGAGTVVFTLSRTTQVSGTATVIIANVNATNSQKATSLWADPTIAVAGSQVTAAVDTTAATTIVITGQKALNTDTLTLEGYTVEAIRVT